MKFNRLGLAKRLLLREKYAKAKKLLRLAATNGDTRAQYLLGLLYGFADSGVGPAEARSWWEIAAKSGHADSIGELALHDFRRGGWATIPSCQSKLRLLQRAARRGSADAQRNLACTYALAEGVPYDPKKAAYWYTKAAEQGHGEALNDIAAMWLDGEAGTVNVQRAIAYYEQCANDESKGPYSAFAAESLHRIYAGVPPGEHASNELAQYWKNRAKYLANMPWRSYPDWFYERSHGA